VIRQAVAGRNSRSRACGTNGLMSAVRTKPRSRGIYAGRLVRTRPASSAVRAPQATRAWATEWSTVTGRRAASYQVGPAVPRLRRRPAAMCSASTAVVPMAPPLRLPLAASQMATFASCRATPLVLGRLVGGQAVVENTGMISGACCWRPRRAPAAMRRDEEQPFFRPTTYESSLLGGSLGAFAADVSTRSTSDCPRLATTPNDTVLTKNVVPFYTPSSHTARRTRRTRRRRQALYCQHRQNGAPGLKGVAHKKHTREY